MLCLSGFELHSRWVPLTAEEVLFTVEWSNYRILPWIHLTSLVLHVLSSKKLTLGKKGFTKPLHNLLSWRE